MKFSTVLAITFLIAAVSAAPQPGRAGYNKFNKEDNSVHTDNSNSGNKKVDQSIGSVGSTTNSGALSGLLGGSTVLGKSSNTNTVTQNGNIY